ncbi:7-carboxy-7-deazaguanine synthase QueE [Streptomyces sp. PT12]|nr:7-carboxy-7-deazaguanine synthase QueE [Streptomyces sp. PT12]
MGRVRGNPVTTAREDELIVAETFGPTFQGEGPSAGQQAVFIRLSRCNLSCGTHPSASWACDTPYTWDWERFDPKDPEVARRESVGALLAWALSLPPRLVVVTGGEPMLQWRGLERLAVGLRAAGREVEVETNGTLVPDSALVEAVTAFNVSPKLAAAGDSERRRIVPDALASLARCGKARFKFVVTHLGELEEIAALVRRFALREVWVMPEGTTAGAVLEGLRAVAEETLARGWHLSARQHVLIWGDGRGR